MRSRNQYEETVDGINDKSVTNDGDSQKVLATVASTVYAFTSKYPNSWVYAIGSTKGRTRLYRMGLSNNILEISKDFYVFGLKDDEWVDFEIGADYGAFLITRKIRNFEI